MLGTIENISVKIVSEDELKSKEKEIVSKTMPRSIINQFRLASSAIERAATITILRKSAEYRQAQINRDENFDFLGIFVDSTGKRYLTQKAATYPFNNYSKSLDGTFDGRDLALSVMFKRIGSLANNAFEMCEDARNKINIRDLKIVL